MATNKCDLCGNAVQDGSYYQKGEVKTCVACAAAMTPDQARALAHDQMRKASEHAGRGNGLPKRTGDEAAKLCQELEVEARRLAVDLIRSARTLASPVAISAEGRAIEVKPAPKDDLDAAERMVKLAAQLDLLADKVLAR